MQACFIKIAPATYSQFVVFFFKASKTRINKDFVESDVKLAHKTVVITGCNTGIGFENALQMVKRGARVLMACRDTNKAEEAKAKVL